jgi:hypothetical protein
VKVTAWDCISVHRYDLLRSVRLREGLELHSSEINHYRHPRIAVPAPRTKRGTASPALRILVVVSRLDSGSIWRSTPLLAKNAAQERIVSGSLQDWSQRISE